MRHHQCPNTRKTPKNDWQTPTGRRTDEWSECLTLISQKEDRAAFTRLFRHFAPLIKAFALSGSNLSATVADELVQEDDAESVAEGRSV